MQNKIWSWCDAYLPPLLWATVIFIFSAQKALPGFSIQVFDFILKKSAHMIIYGIFYALLFRGVNLKNLKTNKNWWTPFLIGLFYAALDEFHQSFTPNRTPTARDVGYDALGMGIAFLKIYRYI
jgi:VanZ family protein